MERILSHCLVRAMRNPRGELNFAYRVCDFDDQVWNHPPMDDMDVHVISYAAAHLRNQLMDSKVDECLHNLLLGTAMMACGITPDTEHKTMLDHHRREVVMYTRTVAPGVYSIRWVLAVEEDEPCA